MNNNLDKIVRGIKDKKLLIFDFDGTIADTIDIEYNVYKKLLSHLGKKMTKPQWKKLLASHTAEGYLNLTNEMFGLKIGYDEFVDMYANACREVEKIYPPRLFEWVKPFFKKVANKQKMMLTNKDGNLIRENLAMLGMNEEFPCVLSCTTLHTTKEECYPNILIQFGVKPSECVIFEDTQRYIDVGKSMEFTMVGVAHKGNYGHISNVDYLVDTTKE